MTTRDQSQPNADVNQAMLPAAVDDEVVGLGGSPGGVLASRAFVPTLMPPAMPHVGEEIPQTGAPPYAGGPNSLKYSPR